MRRIALVCIALASTAFACAPFAETSMQSITAEQRSWVNTMCSDVMGVWSGEVYFQRCQESLANTLVAKAQRDAMAIVYKECAQHGLEEGSAEFSTCILRSPAKEAPETPAVAEGAAPSADDGGDFENISPETRRSREQYVCAQLGLLPGSDPFDGCVSGLEDAFIPSNDKPFGNLLS